MSAMNVCERCCCRLLGSRVSLSLSPSPRHVCVQSVLKGSQMKRPIIDERNADNSIVLTISFFSLSPCVSLVHADFSFCMTNPPPASHLMQMIVDARATMTSRRMNDCYCYSSLLVHVVV